ncbi:Insulinase (Peptidase M16) [Serendipita sp. 397]|nr:Insulinase (Peptidase M16) [Serendipita sp. 397]
MATEASGWHRSEDDQYWQFSGQIEIPDVDSRQYGLIKLENQLEVLLVSDPEADQAAVSLDVGIGHMSDPDDMPGLAHFCEHLSFMGTKDFPVENEYKNYIRKHGGATNASTSSKTTTYHFKVQAPFLEGGIKRFSAFFHSPLFSSSCVLREVNAVDSENSKNQQMDSRRLYQLWKSLSDAHHPWNKFGCGNKDTLLKGNVEDGSESRQRVMDWWQNHYCASRMKVTVVGTESLKVLGDLAYQNFSKVPNRSLGPLPVTTSPPWSTSSGPDLWFVKTVKDTQRLEISFPIPDQDSLYEHKPSSYISHLVGHEGPGSIFNLLHEQGLATTLSCGLHSAGRGVSLMDIDITLTKLGLGQYEKVLSAIFHYITLLPSALEEPYHFEELRKMAQISFANAENPSTSGTHRQWVQTKVYSQLVMDGLTAKGYNATLAGLDYSVYSSLNGVFVTVSGYNDKLLAALDMVLEQVQALQVRSDRFDVVMEKMKRAYDNVYLKQSGEVSDTFLGDCTSERLYSPPFTRRELDYIDVESVRVHGGRLFERIHLTVLIHGNVTHDTAVSWCDRIERRFAAARAVPIPVSACHSRRSLLLPSGCNFVYTAAVPNANEANCAVSYLCQVGDVADVRVRALVTLFSSMVSEPFFSMMRTKEQLGYNVSSSIWNETASGGVRFRIQSTRHPDFLESRIDFFIDWYLDVLKAMQSAEFDEYRRGAVEKKRKKLVNLAEEQARFWNYIENGYLDFERGMDLI